MNKAVKEMLEAGDGQIMLYNHSNYPIEKLVPYARNSRTHSEKQIAQIEKSIKEFGWTIPILIDENGTILAGHGRVLAAHNLGIKDVPTVVASGWTDEQKRAYVIADNKIAANAEWDKDMLALELTELKSADFDLGITGFDPKELVSFVAVSKAGLTGDEDVPTVVDKTVTRLGDLWLLGNHRLVCGDSTTREPVAAVAPGGGIDLLLTDPPYNVAYEGKTAEALTIQNDSMGDVEFLQFLVSAFENANEVMRPGAVFYIWHADIEGFNFRGACRAAGWKVRQCLIWVKDSMVMGRQDYHWQHEPCLYGWKDGAAHIWSSDRKQVTTIHCKRPTRNAEHPTMKPIELMEYQICNNTLPNNTVLDLFGGSGSTLIACEKTDRRARLVELDPKYCDVIIRRWQNFTGQEATLEVSGQTFAEVERGR